MISTASRFNVHGSFTDPSALRAPRPNLGEERGSGFQVSAHRFPLPASPFFTTCKNRNQMLSVMVRNSL